MRTHHMKLPIWEQAASDSLAATFPPDKQAAMLASFDARLSAAADETDYVGVPAPVWRVWISVVLDAIVRCRIGELDRREAFNALKDWAGDHFCVEDIRTRRLCQVVLRVFQRATELV